MHNSQIYFTDSFQGHTTKNPVRQDLCQQAHSPVAAAKYIPTKEVGKSNVKWQKKITFNKRAISPADEEKDCRTRRNAVFPWASEAGDSLHGTLFVGHHV